MVKNSKNWEFEENSKINIYSLVPQINHPVALPELIFIFLNFGILKFILMFYLFVFQVIGVISVFFIVVSIVSFCLKTHPDMRVPVIKNITVWTSFNTTAWTLDKYQTNAHQAFFFVECVCNAWFTIEIIMRFLSCPNKFLFLRSR